jgi:histidine triad (HIT) family protein
MECLFCKIAKKELPAEIVYEDKFFLGFKNIHPDAPTHLLIVPKKHIISVDHLKSEDKELMGELILIAQKIAREQSLAKTGYKLVFNVGKGGGQVIEHLHLHLLAGWRSKKERDIPEMP